MVPNFRRDAVNSASELNNDRRCSAKAAQAKAGLQMVLLLDSQVWRDTRGAPFQFVRWLGALATVVVNWVQSGTLQSAAAYVPVLAVVALLLLPDAQSIEIPGLKFDRLSGQSPCRPSEPITLHRAAERANDQSPAPVSQVKSS